MAVPPDEPRFYVTTYYPLVANKVGRLAAITHDLPPFIDGSIRREPDLAHAFPSISCLCRAGKFAPRLRIGDVVAYLAGKRRYGSHPEPHYRLTAVLQVIETFGSHADAAEWYRGRRLPLPSNCLVPGNPPEPYEQSHQIYRSATCAGSARTYRAWDAQYRGRARKHRAFVVTKPLYRNLTWDAPVVEDADLWKVFGRTPGTQNPGALSLDKLPALMKQLGLPAPPASH